MARKKSSSNSLAVRDNTPVRTSNATRQGPGASKSNTNLNPPQKTAHKASSPNSARTINRGGATLAVQDNQNLRADSFPRAENIPVHNGSPAERKRYPYSPENPPTSGGRKIAGG